MSFYVFLTVLVFSRLMMGIFSDYLSKGALFWIVFFVIGILSGIVPLILLKNGYFESSVFNVSVATIAPFYFAFEIGRLSKNKSLKN